MISGEGELTSQKLPRVQTYFPARNIIVAELMPNDISIQQCCSVSLIWHECHILPTKYTDFHDQSVVYWWVLRGAQHRVSRQRLNTTRHEAMRAVAIRIEHAVYQCGVDTVCLIPLTNNRGPNLTIRLFCVSY